MIRGLGQILTNAAVFTVGPWIPKNWSTCQNFRVVERPGGMGEVGLDPCGRFPWQVESFGTSQRLRHPYCTEPDATRTAGHEKSSAAWNSVCLTIPLLPSGEWQ